MNKPKIILIPSVDSVVNTYAKFTKGKRYTATAFTKCSGEMLYRVSDDYGREYHVNPRSSQYLGGHRFDIDLALSDATCESFMREPFSRIVELENQVAFLTGELQAANSKIENVRKIMRSKPGHDIEDYARVLRMMADAFAKL